MYTLSLISLSERISITEHTEIVQTASDLSAEHRSTAGSSMEKSIDIDVYAENEKAELISFLMSTYYRLIGLQLA